MRDLVADALNTSTTQIARFNAIENNLTPEFNDFNDKIPAYKVIKACTEYIIEQVLKDEVE